MEKETPPYEILRIKGTQGPEELIVHICRQGNDDAVEVLIPSGQPIILSQKQFSGLLQWVEQKLEELRKIERFVN